MWILDKLLEYGKITITTHENGKYQVRCDKKRSYILIGGAENLYSGMVDLLGLLENPKILRRIKKIHKAEKEGYGN